MSRAIPLAPGFSPVMAARERRNRFNGFARTEKPLKRLVLGGESSTRLKPGVNRIPSANCDE